MPETITKVLHFDGEPRQVQVRPIPTVCRTDFAADVIDPDGCGGSAWICPACHQGDDCPEVGSDECRPGLPGAITCVCVEGQRGNWCPSTLL